MKKSRLLSASYGVCGKARSAGNVDYLGKEGNEVHRPRMTRLTGGSGARADYVGPLGKVVNIACEVRLASPRAKPSELSRLFHQPARSLVPDSGALETASVCKRV